MRDRFSDLFSPLAQRECRLLLGSQLISGLGDWAGRLALAVLVFERSDSAWWTAAVTIVSLIPWLGPGQLLSTFADRFGRVRVMIAADIARSALFVLMLAPWSLPALLVLAFLAGLCVPPFRTARGAALVDVVPREQYGKALALYGAVSQAELVAGYALGGVVIALLGAQAALAANAATFLVSAAMVATIRNTSASERHTESALGWAGVRAGMVVWRTDALCRRALLLFVGVNMLMSLPEALIVPYADEIGSPPGAVGLLAAIIAIGSFIAMALSPTSDDHANLLRMAAVRTLVLASLTAVLFTVSVTWLPAAGVAALFVSGAVDAIAVPTNQVVGQRLPRKGRAAAMSVAGGVQYGSQAIAITVGGALAVLIGPGTVVALGAAGSVAVVVWSLAVPVKIPLADSDPAVASAEGDDLPGADSTGVFDRPPLLPLRGLVSVSKVFERPPLVPAADSALEPDGFSLPPERSRNGTKPQVNGTKPLVTCFDRPPEASTPATSVTSDGFERPPDVPTQNGGGADDPRRSEHRPHR